MENKKNVIDFPNQPEIESKDTESEFKDVGKSMTLSYLVQKVTEYQEGKISLEDLDELGKEISIRAYLPLIDKMTCVLALVSGMQYNTAETYEVKIVEMYKEMFFSVLLGKYGMIDVSDRTLYTYSNYDLLYPIIGKFLLAYCKDDYEMIEKMIKDSMNYYGLTSITDAVGAIDMEELKKNTDSNEKFIKGLEQNKDLIHDLKEIMVFNDSTTKKFVDTVRKGTLESQKVNVEGNNVEDGSAEKVDVESGIEDKTPVSAKKETTAKTKKASTSTKKSSVSTKKTSTSTKKTASTTKKTSIKK